MRPAARLTLPALLLATVAACGGSPPPEDVEDARARGRDTDQTVFDDTIQTQDRARAVEDLTLGRKGELDAAMRDMEGEAPPQDR